MITLRIVVSETNHAVTTTYHADMEKATKDEIGILSHNLKHGFQGHLAELQRVAEETLKEPLDLKV